MDVQLAAHAATVADLLDGVLGQGRGIDDVIQPAVHQPRKRHPAVGDHFGQQVFAAFGLFVAESVTCLLADLRQHVEKAFFAGRDRACGCDHGRTS